MIDDKYNHLYVLCIQLKALRGKYDNYIVHSIIACSLKHKLFLGLKFAQVNNLTVDCHCCLRWRLCHCCLRWRLCHKLFTFLSSSPEPQGQYQLNIVQGILG